MDRAAVLCGEFEQTANGAVMCSTELALVSDEDSEIVMGPEAFLVDGRFWSTVVAPCHGVAANGADLRFLYDDLECQGIAWVGFDGTVRGLTDDESVVDTQCR